VTTVLPDSSQAQYQIASSSRAALGCVRRDRTRTRRL